MPRLRYDRPWRFIVFDGFWTLGSLAHHLKQLGYDTSKLHFQRFQRTFDFGGDHKKISALRMDCENSCLSECMGNMA